MTLSPLRPAAFGKSINTAATSKTRPASHTGLRFGNEPPASRETFFNPLQGRKISAAAGSVVGGGLAWAFGANEYVIGACLVVGLFTGLLGRTGLKKLFGYS